MITLGTSSIGIGLAIHLRDKFTQRSNAISRQMRMLHGNAQRVQRDNLHAMNRLGYGMAGAGVAMTMGVTGAVKASAKFQFIMKGVQAITDATEASINRLAEKALKLGRESVFTADEVASAMEYMARAGFKDHQIDKTIGSIVALGAATDKAIGGKGGVADYMTHIMHGFNIGVEGSRRVADLMTKATIVSSSDVEDVHEALKYFAGTAKTLNISLEESLAMTATLSNAGLRGGIAGRGINNMLLYLATAVGQFKSTRQAEALQAIGLGVKDIVDSSGNIRPVIQLVKTFSSHLAKMPKIEQVSALKQLLNIRGARALIPLGEASKLGMDFATILDEITNKSTGVADKIAKMRMDNLHGDFLILQDTWKTFMIEIGNTLTPIVRWGTQLITKVVNKLIDFSKTPLGKPFIILAAAGAIALGISGALLVAFTSIKLLTLGSTVSFANMGRTLALAWNTGTAAALRYATTAKGATMVSTPFGPRWRGANGKFTKGATGTSIMGFGGGGLKTVGAFIKNLASANGMLGFFGRALKVVTGPIGWIGTILGAVMGFRNIIKLIGFGLAQFLNHLIFAGRMMWEAAIHPIDTFMGRNANVTAAARRHAQTTQNLREAFGLKKLDGGESLTKSKLDYNQTQGFIEKFNEQMRTFTPTTKRTIKVDINGKALFELTEDEKSKSLQSLFSPVPNN